MKIGFVLVLLVVSVALLVSFASMEKNPLPENNLSGEIYRDEYNVVRIEQCNIVIESRPKSRCLYDSKTRVRTRTIEAGTVGRIEYQAQSQNIDPHINMRNRSLLGLRTQQEPINITEEIQRCDGQFDYRDLSAREFNYVLPDASSGEEINDDLNHAMRSCR